jgi:hypothetical protein
MMYALRPLAVASALMIAACGEPLATGGYRPAFITIKGTIASSTVTALPANVRIALLWQNDQTGMSYSAQDVAVRAEFPVGFSLDVTDVPKSQVVHALRPDTAAAAGLDPEMRWALGTLVVYADDDSNQQLDIVDPGIPSHDRILGAATDLDIFYLAAGKPASSDWIGLLPIAAGFSLTREPPHRDPKPGECGRFTAQGHFTQLCSSMSDSLPLTIASGQAVTITLSDDPLLARYACRTFWGPLDYADWDKPSSGDLCDGGGCTYCQGYQCPLDLPPAGVTPTCAPDGTSYVYKTCVDDAVLCGTRFCHFGHGERAIADPPPAGWPCP